MLREDRAIFQAPELCGPFHGSELADAFSSGTLSHVVERGPAVYLWLRRLSPPSRAIANSDQFIDWLVNHLGRTQGVVEDQVRHLGGVQLRLGGATASPKKLETFSTLAKTRAGRRALQRLLSQFDYTVALYVGETDDLLVRIAQHLAGSTEFSRRILTLGYSWEELGLKYLPLIQSTAPERRALERALAILTLAPATARAG